MNYSEKYQVWLNSTKIDETTKQELESIKDNVKEIEDRFYKDLSFGTGGLRGVIGAGSNRMNVYTVRRATQGLANYLNQHKGSKRPSVAIAYDSRHFSDTFALEAALVLAGNGIKAYLFDDLRPTPELSFTVRELGCDAGIVVTASHNPPEYNGYKVYGDDGGQITLEVANGIISAILEVDIFEDVKQIEENVALAEGLLAYIGEELDEKYLSKVIGLSLDPAMASKVPDLKIVYTPLHGSGLMPVGRALDMLGYKNVVLVPSQTDPDGSFPTVKSPNPEEKAAFTKGIELAEDIDADILLGTDPDADRVGVVVKDTEGEYRVLTGNQIGALLTHYIVSSQEKVTSKDAVIKTIVTSELGARIAASYGATIFDTLTGFKFIGEKIKEFEQTQTNSFLFGYEESYGYLAGTFVRDKDAVIASVLIVEMTAYYKNKGMSLFEAIESIYRQYGYYSDALESFVFKGAEGAEKIAAVVEKFRDYDKVTSAFADVETIEDFQSSQRKSVADGTVEGIELPQANVIKVHFKDKSWFAIRPSGTEPKLKIYYSTMGKVQDQAVERMDGLKSRISHFIG